MKMYIANRSKQNQMFSYRVPDDNGTLTRPRVLNIAPGSQIALPENDLSTPQIDAIIEQHRKYGLMSVEDALRGRGFSALCYSLNKPISVNNIMLGIQHNDRSLREKGVKQRQEAGVAAFQGAEQAAQEVGLGLSEVEFTVIENNPDKNSGTREGDPVAEGIRVTNRSEPTTPTRAGKRR
jgi:hypothetical protein